MLDLCPAPRRAFFLCFILGAASQTRLTFSHCRKRPCGPLLQKASTPNCRPQDKFIFIRAFYNLSLLGRRPKPALLFLIAEKEGKKASTPGSHKIYFYPGILQPFFQGLHPLPAFLFFIAKKVSKKLAPREAIKFIFIRAFYNSLRSDK